MQWLFGFKVKNTQMWKILKLKYLRMICDVSVHKLRSRAKWPWKGLKWWMVKLFVARLGHRFHTLPYAMRFGIPIWDPWKSRDFWTEIFLFLLTQNAKNQNLNLIWDKKNWPESGPIPTSVTHYSLLWHHNTTDKRHLSTVIRSVIMFQPTKVEKKRSSSVNE